jgi:hypothetical protein
MGRSTFVQTKGEPNGTNNTNNKVAGTIRSNFGINQIPPHKRTGLVGSNVGVEIIFSIRRG